MLKDVWNGLMALLYCLRAKWYVRSKPMSWKTLDKAMTCLVRAVQRLPEDYNREEVRQIFVSTLTENLDPDMMENEKVLGYINAFKNA